MRTYVNREKVWLATIKTLWEVFINIAERQKEPVLETERLPIILELENEILKRKK